MNNKSIGLIVVNIILVLSLLQSTFLSTAIGMSIPAVRIIHPYENIDDNIIDLIQDLNIGMIVGVLENLTSFGPRVTGTKACIDAGDYIYTELNDNGLSVRHHYWNHTSSVFGSNIEATLPGMDPSSDDIFIVCAHYDTVQGSPGADDDGSGVAAVLAAAELLSEYQFKHTVKFVAFAGEEQGLVGSRYYVTEAYENGDNIVGVINADMIGYTSTTKGETTVTVYSDYDSQWLVDSISETSDKYNAYVNLEVDDAGYSGSSDHVPFWSGGYNAIFVAEYEFSPHWHRHSDTIENMTPSYATNVCKLILATLAGLAEFHENNPPITPSAPLGVVNGAAGKEYPYSCVTTDPEGDLVYYRFDWGDGNLSHWLGPYYSGEIIDTTYTWVEQGTYEIKVMAKDTYGAESDWSDSLEISMPKNYMTRNDGILKIFYYLINYFRSLYHQLQV